MPKVAILPARASLDRGRYRRGEGRLVEDQMVGRQDQHHGAGAAEGLRLQRGERDRRRGVAPERLEQERRVVGPRGRRAARRRRASRSSGRGW